MKQKLVFLMIFLAINTYLLTNFIKPPQIEKQNIHEKDSIDENKTSSNCELKYKNECLKLYAELNNPDPKAFFRPPLEKIPEEMLAEFTQNGEMPVTTYWYFNNVYTDAIDTGKKEVKEIISKQEVDSLRTNVSDTRTGHYGDNYMRRFMTKYVKGDRVAVIGTEMPWVEAIALDAGASKIVTLDFTRKAYEQSDVLDWIHVQDYYNSVLKSEILEDFDSVASFSSIEHSGLGRYGDPLDPNGDIKAVQQVHCMLKNGGLFFLGLPASGDNSSYIEFNAHRVYGTKRLDKLFQGWHLIEQTNRDEIHSVFVLKKVKTC